MAIMTIGFNPALDRILECADFHIGGHQQARQIARLAAGKAANVNRALAQLGCDSLAMGFVGADDVEFFHEQLMACGPGRILCRFVEVAGQTRENITILDPRRRLETHLRDVGFTVTMRDAELLREKILHELKEGDFAIFAGSLATGVDEGFFSDLLDQCIRSQVRVVVDSSGPPLKAAAAKDLWLIKPNLEELRQLVGVEVPNAAAAIRDTAAPLLKHTRNILVSRGPMGAVLLTREGTYSARLAAKDMPVRTVGCGDHLLAGFVAEITAGKAVEEALVTALAVATARAMSPKMEEFEMRLVESARASVVVERI
jgi:1-phosphofructokinase family hexose kinase